MNKLDDISQLSQLLKVQSGYSILYFAQGIEVCLLDQIEQKINGRELNHLIRFDLMSEDQSVHGWRSGADLKYRSISDNDFQEYHITEHVVESVIADQLVELDPEKFKKDSTKPIMVVAHDYIAYHADTHQAGFVASRLVTFKQKSDA